MSSRRAKRFITEPSEARHKQPPREVHYRAERDPGGNLWYIVGGVGYPSLSDVRDAYPGSQLRRVKRSTTNKPLFG